MFITMLNFQFKKILLGTFNFKYVDNYVSFILLGALCEYTIGGYFFFLIIWI